MKTILIPTDYHEDTLQALEMTWRSPGDELIQIVLLSISPLPDSIMGYLSTPANNEVTKHKRNELMAEWKIRKSLLDISIQLIEHYQYGGSLAIVEQIIERFEVSQIIVPYSFQRSKEPHEMETLNALKKSQRKLILMPDRSGTLDVRINQVLMREPNSFGV